MPSIGGGTKLMRTLFAGEGEGVCSVVGEAARILPAKQTEKEILPGSAKELGWAIPVRLRFGGKRREIESENVERRSAIRDLCIIAPVHVRKNVVPPFAVAQKFFI